MNSLQFFLNSMSNFCVASTRLDISKVKQVVPIRIFSIPTWIILPVRQMAQKKDWQDVESDVITALELKGRGNNFLHEIFIQRLENWMQWEAHLRCWLTPEQLRIQVWRKKNQTSWHTFKALTFLSSDFIFWATYSQLGHRGWIMDLTFRDGSHSLSWAVSIYILTYT